MQNQLLLLEDVGGLGRKGEIVRAKAGFVRNFLLPQKKCVIANANTLKMQDRLKQEREKQTAVDRKASEELAAKLKNFILKTEVKIDADGKMYGSVTQLEIARMMQEKGFALERRHVTLPQAVKSLGIHTIPLRLAEGVSASVTLEVLPEGGPIPEKKKEEEKKEEAEEETPTE